MTEDKKTPVFSVEDTLSTIKDAAQDDTVSGADESVLDLTETEMLNSNEEQNEELIDIKSFDETGEIKQADEASELVAKAQHGDDMAIEQLSKSLMGDEETPAAATSQEEQSQDDVDALLNNIGQVAETTPAAQEEAPVQEETSEDLSQKAEMLEKTSKTYSQKDFAGSQEYAGEDDDEGEDDDKAPAPTAASFEDLAAAMASQTAEEKQAEQQQEEVIKELETKVTKKVALKAVPSVTGLQVGFPVEVLAEALRPMISDWVEENLPSIVEKLVKEELSKLADK